MQLRSDPPLGVLGHFNGDGESNFILQCIYRRLFMLTNLVVVLGAKEDGDEGEPDDAGAVH